MAATFQGTTSLTVNARYATALDRTTPVESVSLAQDQTYTSGNGSNQANAFIVDTRSLAGIPETIDLTADLKDAFGTTLLFTKIREISIISKSSTAGEELAISGNLLDGMMKGTTVLATGTLTAAANPADTDTVTIDSKVYTFQTTLTDVDGNVLIGATASDSLDNLIAAINLAAGSGSTYAASMTKHPSVSALAGTGDTMDITAKVGATRANAISTTETSANLSWGASTMSGGTGAEDVTGPSGVWHKRSPIDGFTVTNTTQDQLTIDPGSATISYDLIVVGIL